MVSPEMRALQFFLFLVFFGTTAMAADLIVYDLDPAKIWQSFSEAEKLSRLASFEEKYRNQRWKRSNHPFLPNEAQFNLIIMAASDPSDSVRARATSILGEHFYFRTNVRGDAFYGYESDVYVDRKPVVLTGYENLGLGILISRVNSQSIEVSKAAVTALVDLHYRNLSQEWLDLSWKTLSNDSLQNEVKLHLYRELVTAMRLEEKYIPWPMPPEDIVPQHEKRLSFLLAAEIMKENNMPQLDEVVELIGKILILKSPIGDRLNDYLEKAEFEALLNALTQALYKSNQKAVAAAREIIYGKLFKNPASVSRLIDHARQAFKTDYAKEFSLFQASMSQHGRLQLQNYCSVLF